MKPTNYSLKISPLLDGVTTAPSVVVERSLFLSLRAITFILFSHLAPPLPPAMCFNLDNAQSLC